MKTIRALSRVVFDNRHDFNFDIGYCPFIIGNISVYCVFRSYPRASSSVDDINVRHITLVMKIPGQCSTLKFLKKCQSY